MVDADNDLELALLSENAFLKLKVSLIAALDVNTCEFDDFDSAKHQFVLICRVNIKLPLRYGSKSSVKGRRSTHLISLHGELCLGVPSPLLESLLYLSRS